MIKFFGFMDPLSLSREKSWGWKATHWETLIMCNTNIVQLLSILSGADDFKQVTETANGF